VTLVKRNYFIAVVAHLDGKVGFVDCRATLRYQTIMFKNLNTRQTQAGFVKRLSRYNLTCCRARGHGNGKRRGKVNTPFTRESLLALKALLKQASSCKRGIRLTQAGLPEWITTPCPKIIGPLQVIWCKIVNT